MCAWCVAFPQLRPAPCPAAKPAWAAGDALAQAGCAAAGLHFQHPKHTPGVDKPTSEPEEVTSGTFEDLLFLNKNHPGIP